MSILYNLANLAIKAAFPAQEAKKSTPTFGGSVSVLNMGQTPFSVGSPPEKSYTNKIFYTAQNILVKKLVEAPIMFTESTQKSQRAEKFYGSATSAIDRHIFKQKVLKEVENHDLNRLFDRPNSFQTGIELMEDFWFNYALGDAYLYFHTLDPEISRNRKPVEVYCLFGPRVMAQRSTDRFNQIAYYKYQCVNGESINIHPDNILHMKRWVPNNLMFGLGQNMIAELDIALNTANNMTQGAAFANGGRGTLFSSDIEVTNDGEKVFKLSGTQHDELKRSIESDFMGMKNYRKGHFTNGKVEVQSFGDTVAEMELIQAEDSQWTNIFAICGVPWALSPVASKSAENTVIQAYKSLVTNTVLPEIRKFDQKLTQKIYQWWPNIIAVTDVTAYSELAVDYKTLKETIGEPLLTNDERRNAHGYDSWNDERGKAVMVTSSMTTLDDILTKPADEMTLPANDQSKLEDDEL